MSRSSDDKNNINNGHVLKASRSTDDKNNNNSCVLKVSRTTDGNHNNSHVLICGRNKRVRLLKTILEGIQSTISIIGVQVVAEKAYAGADDHEDECQ